MGGVFFIITNNYEPSPRNSDCLKNLTKSKYRDRNPDGCMQKRDKVGRMGDKGIRERLRMEDADARYEEMIEESSKEKEERDEMQERRDLAMLKFPRREEENEEAYAGRIEKICQILPGMWQPGQSGNPHGKRKRASGFKDALEYAMGEKIQLKFVDGDIEGIAKIDRKELFMKNMMDMLTHGQVVFPKFGPKGGAGSIYGRTVSLSAKDWADFALKFLRYIDPPVPVEKTTEVRQVVFDLGTMLPTKVKQKIIKQKTGQDPIIYEEQDYIEGEVIEDGEE